MQDDDYVVEGRRWLAYAWEDLQAADAAINQMDFDLTSWAVGARYPTFEEPTDEDAARATGQARSLLNAVRRDLIAHGFVAAQDAGQEGVS